VIAVSYYSALLEFISGKQKTLIICTGRIFILQQIYICPYNKLEEGGCCHRFMQKLLSNTYVIFFFILFVSFSGCATTGAFKGHIQKEFESENELLLHLKKEVSTKEEIVKLFGSPNATFINGKVLTYRIVIEEDGKLLIPILVTKWRVIKYSLVLFFGDDQTLIDYSLVSVK
jgi:hypothetical protein